MRNKIACSADKLSSLDPAMIQSVVDAPAFKLGSQYLTENRVKILKANSRDILSTVIGHSGLYEQSVELKNGMLITQCSCGSAEQPLCRHCVGVLLEYYRWSNRQSRSASPTPGGRNGERGQEDETAVASEINLRDLAVFVEWIQLAVSALKRGHPFPEFPAIDSRQIREWGESIIHLERRHEDGEATKRAMEGELRAREREVARLTDQLGASTKDLQAAQVAAEDMQREIAQYRLTLRKVRDISKDLEQVALQTKGLATHLTMHGSLLGECSVSLKQSSESLKNLDNDATP